MKTIFDQITDNLRQVIEKYKAEMDAKDLEIDRLRAENNLLRQELEHKAFQDDF